MTTLLHISASPRGASSSSNQAAEIFLGALPDGVKVSTLDLSIADLPPVTEEITQGKVKAFMGAELTDEEARQWQAVVDLVDAFKAADHYLFGVPMWNFTVPYTLKHYIDLITQPGLTFGRDDNGPVGLVSGSATFIYSRGGNYSPAEDGTPDPFDFQSTYLQAWSKMVGLSPVNEVLVQKTMMEPDAALEGAREQLTALATALS